MTLAKQDSDEKGFVCEVGMSMEYNVCIVMNVYRQHDGSSLILVDCISVDEYYHISPVNMCWL